MTAPIPPGYPQPEPRTGPRWWERRWLQLAVAGLVIFIIGAAIGSAGNKSSKNAAAVIPTPDPATVTATMPVPGETATVSTTTTQTATATITTTYTPVPVTAFSGEGTYLVGKDVKPGTYRSAGPDGSNAAGCYYELDSESGDILSNDVSKGQLIVHVPASAFELKVEGCSDFTAA